MADPAATDMIRPVARLGGGGGGGGDGYGDGDGGGGGGGSSAAPVVAALLRLSDGRSAHAATPPVTPPAGHACLGRCYTLQAGCLNGGGGGGGGGLFEVLLRLYGGTARVT